MPPMTPSDLHQGGATLYSKSVFCGTCVCQSERPDVSYGCERSSFVVYISAAQILRADKVLALVLKAGAVSHNYVTCVVV